MLWLLLICIAIIAIAGAIFFLQRPRLSFAALILLLPLHTGVFQIARIEFNLPSSVALLLQSWKEAVLVLLILWIILRVAITGRLRGAHLWMIFLVGLFIVSGVLSLRSSPSLAAGLYSFRGTFEPLFVLLLTLLLPLDIRWCKRLIPPVFLVGGIIAGFAIFQALVLGFDFIWKYYAQDGLLPTSFVFMGGNIQRAMGTFSSPNQLSLYLTFLIILAVNLFLRIPQKYRLALGLIILLFAALLLTVSRSGWSALIAGLGFSFLIWRRKQRVILFVAGLALLAVVIASVMGLDTWILQTLSGREVSANYHYDLIVENLRVISDNPLGVGLGRVGARSFRYRDPLATSGYYPSESYLLQTSMELGVQGFIIFMLIVVTSGIVVYKNIFRLSGKWSRALAVSAFAALCAALVHSILIPDLQDMAVSSYLWLLVGLGMRLPALEKQEMIAQ